eukprot:gene22409-27037_t
MKRSRECEVYEEEAGEVGYLASSWKKLRKVFFGGRTGVFGRTWSALFGSKEPAQEASDFEQGAHEDLTAPAKEVEVDKTAENEEEVPGEEMILDLNNADEACPVPVVVKPSQVSEEAAPTLPTPTDEDENAEGISELSSEVDEVELQAEKPCPDAQASVIITLSSQALPIQCSVEE